MEQLRLLTMSPIQIVAMSRFATVLDALSGNPFLIRLKGESLTSFVASSGLLFQCGFAGKLGPVSA